MGRFYFKWKEKLKDFVKLQEYTSKFGRKANHFHIVGEHTAILRIKRILKVDKNISKDELEFTIENLAKKFVVVDHLDIIGNYKPKTSYDIDITEEYKELKSLLTEKEYLELKGIVVMTKIFLSDRMMARKRSDENENNSFVCRFCCC